MAKQSTVGYLPGNDPAAQQANLDYQNALMRMEEALNARQNRFLDPTMLALAQGFLAPTQTGSFGESLGMAAKNVRQAQQEEEKEERAIAEARLGLAGKGLELEQRRQRARRFEQDPAIRALMPSLGGAAPSGAAPAGGGLPRGQAPSGGALSQVAPEAAPLGGTLPSGEPMSALQDNSRYAAIQIAPPNPLLASGSSYLLEAALEGRIDLSEAKEKAAKIEKDRYVVAGGNIIDLGAGRQYVDRSGPLVEVQIFDVATGKPLEGTYKVDPGTAAELAAAIRARDPELYERIASGVISGPGVKKSVGVGEKPAGERKPTERVKPIGAEEPEDKEGKPGRISSVQETEAKAAGMKEEAQLTAKEQSEESKKWYARGDDASSVMNDYRILRGIFAPTNPSAKLMTGVFEQGDVASQVGTLLESGLTGESLKTAARKIATNAGLNDTQIAQFQVAVGAMASIKLKASRIMEGQGTITEAERLLIAESAIGITDTPKTVLAKTELFMARAKFEERRARALREFRESGKGNYNQFVLSPQYTRMKNEYENEVERVVEKRLGIKIPKNQEGSRDNAGAASRLPEDVR